MTRRAESGRVPGEIFAFQTFAWTANAIKVGTGVWAAARAQSGAPGHQRYGIATLVRRARIRSDSEIGTGATKAARRSVSRSDVHATSTTSAANVTNTTRTAEACDVALLGITAGSRVTTAESRRAGCRAEVSQEQHVNRRMAPRKNHFLVGSNIETVD
jgi:hypothetical protein